MNNEKYNQTIDEAYENYKKITNNFQLQNPIDDLIIKTLRGEMIKIETEDGDDYRILSHEEFINKCKTEPSFSETYGLKIEERELSLEERYNIWFNNNYETGMERFFDPNELPDFDNSYYEPTPTNVVTVTYKDEKIEVYE